ncbi:ABC transporter substrate-binding protein [Streptomyces sp. NPDC016566]|uniref:ABC transporter substrate-binding protein n=1 Tax=Streptomyces sp. NPDC016566 TaxID=3364967 RepID=UPI0036FD43CE
MRPAASIAALATGLALFAMAACSSPSGRAGSVGSAYGDCLVSGKRAEFKLTPEVADTLTVEASLPAPGWWNGNTPNSVKDGFEYCMAANIAYRAGLGHVKVKSVPFASLAEGKTKGFDVALSEITITDKRKEISDFSPPYLYAEQGVGTRKGVKIDSKSIHNARIGVALGTTGARFVTDRLKPAKPVKVFPSAPDMIAGLTNGEVDAVVHDSTILLAFARQPKTDLQVVGQYRTDEPYGALYPKGSPNKATLDRIIKQMIEDGTLTKFSAVYLGAAYGIDPTKLPYFTVGNSS